MKRRHTGTVIMLVVLAGCAGVPRPVTPVPPLPQARADEIRTMISSGSFLQALEKVDFIRRDKIEVPDLETLASQAADSLSRAFTAAVDAGNYADALRLLDSARALGRPEIAGKWTAKSLLGEIAAAQEKAGDSVLALLSRLRMLAQETPSEGDYAAALAAATTVGNKAVARTLVAAMKARGFAVPTSVDTDPTPSFPRMISGTVTILVDRGIKVENGVGYRGPRDRQRLLHRQARVHPDQPPRDRERGRPEVQGLLAPVHPAFGESRGGEDSGEGRRVRQDPRPCADQDRDHPGVRLRGIRRPGADAGGQDLRDRFSRRPGEDRDLGNRLGHRAQAPAGRRLDAGGRPGEPRQQRRTAARREGRPDRDRLRGNPAVRGPELRHPVQPGGKGAARRSTRAGRPSHPWLGMAVAETDKGLEVVYALPDEPAAIAGIRAGDIIENLDGAPYKKLGDIQAGRPSPPVSLARHDRAATRHDRSEGPALSRGAARRAHRDRPEAGTRGTTCCTRCSACSWTTWAPSSGKATTS